VTLQVGKLDDPASRYDEDDDACGGNRISDMMATGAVGGAGRTGSLESLPAL